MLKRTVLIALVLSILSTTAWASSDLPGARTSDSAQAAATGCPTGTTQADRLCLAPGGQAKRAAEVVRSSFQEGSIEAITVGVWKDGKPLVVGALGESTPNVAATADMHHRTGNIASAMLTTVLLQQVEAGKLSLTDPLSKWYPALPSADAITVEMLARSQSGYKHYTIDPAFQKAFYEDPFKTFTPDEIIAFGVAGGPAFPPGTSQSFSDTNLVILQQVIEKATGRPMGALLKEGVIGPLGLKDTTLPTAAMREPVLHSYTNERGVYEEATYWNPSWIGYAGGLASNQEDLRRFIEAEGAGSLLSKAGHRAQLAPVTVGQGRNTADAYYAMGTTIVDGWIFSNPGLQGIQAGLGNLANKKLTIIVYVTLSPSANFDKRYAQPVLESLSTIFAPNHPVKLG